MFIGGAGCVGKSQTTISKIDPYVGERPDKMGALPPPPRIRPQPPKTADGEPGWMPGNGLSNRWKYVVIHHSANDRSTPQGMADWHVRGRGWDALGYHFVIGNGVGYEDGRVFVGERWPKQMHGAHCKTPGNEYNDHGIGICLIGDLDRHPPTAKQVQSLARLLAFLSKRCRVPESRIVTHGGVTRKTACPGRHFSLPSVLRRMPVETVSATSE